MKLDANVIGAAALELLDETGLDGLTMRKVASALNVQAPALYWHVKNKQELLDVMARAVFTAAVDRVEGRAGARAGRTGSPNWPGGCGVRCCATAMAADCSPVPTSATNRCGAQWN